jgi:hypothetical protein
LSKTARENRATVEKKTFFLTSAQAHLPLAYRHFVPLAAVSK